MPEEDGSRVKTTRTLSILLSIVMLILMGRLAQLQLLQGQGFVEAARNQTVRVLPLPAPRGQILDRNHVVLATDKPAYIAYLVYSRQKLTAKQEQLLSRILQIDPDVIDAAKKQLSVAKPFAPVPLKVGLTPAQQTALAEHLYDLPGVLVRAVPLRVYPGLPDYPQIGGRLASHLLGYVSLGGNTGIEGTYNGPLKEGNQTMLGLQGKDGAELVEVDFRGRPVKEQPPVAPTPGNNVVLTLDARLQAVAQQALTDRMAYLRQAKDLAGGPFPATTGAVVVMDVHTGGILAMASEPTFDPNDFARAAQMGSNNPDKAWAKEYGALLKDPGKPLLNHALFDAVAPGSIFKPITALAALSRGWDPWQRLFDPGYFKLGGQTFGDWVPGGSGYVNLIQALARSDDIYFYNAGLFAGIDAIDRVARMFGLGERSGLRDIAGETKGILASPEAFRQIHAKDHQVWTQGQVVISSIGQGLNSFTPIQIANYVATLANGGTRYRPYLVQQVVSPDGRVLFDQQPEVLGRVDLPKENLDLVKQGMLAVTSYNPSWEGTGIDSAYGTAWWFFRDLPEVSQRILGHPVYAAGKTGTAEVAGHRPNGWFISFAPYDKPEIAIAVYMTEVNGGAISGGPVARAIIDAYLGLPITPVVPQGFTPPGRTE